MSRLPVGWMFCLVAAAMLLAAGAVGLAQDGKSAAPDKVTAKGGHMPEVKAILGALTVDPPRKHKNLLVFPIRFAGKQAPGEWTTLDEATTAGNLKVLEKDQASVPEVHVENVGARTILVVSGEIIKGGKQTRVSRQDAILEPKQQVAMAVFCVEQHRWSGGKDFVGSGNMAPVSIQDSMKRGASQTEVWDGVRKANEAAGYHSATDSLEEGLSAPAAKERKAAAHADIGKLSPPDTIGVALADQRTGRVVGLELFGSRSLFEKLQDKLIEGYALDLVPANVEWKDADAKKVTEKDVEDFIARAQDGTSQYEQTPGGGRGIDLVAGTSRGKGVANGDSIIHLSIQDVRPAAVPVRPIVDRPPTREPPIRDPMPTPYR